MKIKYGIVACGLCVATFMGRGINAEAASVIDTKEEIHKACDTRATCQDSIEACIVDIDGTNPYDVTWDYGPDWDAYVDACDWSLVFDATYYKKAYPVLAVLYNNDDELLLKHFSTVGVHEGRQGCEAFNVEAYLDNCDYDVYKTFKTDVEGGYIYYMLHYDEEKNVNTKMRSDGTTPRTQLFNIYTKAQNVEYERVNDYRTMKGSEEVTLNGELCSLANYRAYVNRVNGSVYGQGHDWAKANKDKMYKYMECVKPSAEWLDENTFTGRYVHRVNIAQKYYDSKSHREAMLKPEASITGISNFYYSKADGLYSEFDVYMP